MAIKDIDQPEIISINQNLRIRKPDKLDWKQAVPWYQNKKIMHFSEGINDRVYNLEEVKRMYAYLSSIGELYFIEVYEG